VRRKRILAGILALLLVGTFTGSLLGGTRDSGNGTTTTSRPAPTTSTTTAADRQALIAAGGAVAAALAPVPAGDVQGADDQNTPLPAVVDIVAIGRYDRSDAERFVFLETRGGPPDELAGCLQLRATYAAAAGIAWEGEINLGAGPCASRGAFEKGRMAGFLLPVGALWVFDLDAVAGSGAVSGIAATQFLAADEGATLADTTAIALDAPPVPTDVAEALIPLLHFRPANPPDGAVAG